MEVIIRLRSCERASEENYLFDQRDRLCACVFELVFTTFYTIEFETNIGVREVVLSDCDLCDYKNEKQFLQYLGVVYLSSYDEVSNNLLYKSTSR